MFNPGMPFVRYFENKLSWKIVQNDAYSNVQKQNFFKRLSGVSDTFLLLF